MFIACLCSIWETKHIFYVLGVYLDGFCDDACRTEECLWDATDCTSACVGDLCYIIYGVFVDAAGPDVYLMSHDKVCGQAIPEMYAKYPLEQFNINYTLCMELIIHTDHNKDNHVNFREMIHAGYEIYENAFGDTKPSQVCLKGFTF